MEQPRHVVLRETMMHLAHHRGQLTVYLRLAISPCRRRRPNGRRQDVRLLYSGGFAPRAPYTLARGDPTAPLRSRGSLAAVFDAHYEVIVDHGDGSVIRRRFSLFIPA